MNNTQIRTNAYSGNALLLHLHTLGEFSIGLDPFQPTLLLLLLLCVNQYSVTVELYETSEGSCDLLSECEVVPNILNSSNDLFKRTLFNGMSESDYQE